MLVALAVAVATAGVAAAEPPDPAGPSTQIRLTTCPALYALGIQGTGESSPDAAPTTDTGMLSTVFRPMMAKAPDTGLVDRAYVPYESGFGGATAGGAAPYSESVADGLARLRGMAATVADACPNSRFAVVGYSQGAHVASMFAQEIGQGRGVLPAEKIAAVALFGDPTRNPGAPLFPGAPGKATPDPAPGTSGDRLVSIAALPQTPATGGGIGPERDKAANFGALTGRVASFCAAGDLACDAPDGAPILKAVANVAGQSKLSGGDPIASLVSIAQALAFTSIKTATEVVKGDIQGNSLATLSISPRKSISQRLADASDPRTPLDLPAALQALLKVGMIGLNSVIAVVRTVLAPANITELATAGLANPPAALLSLGAKLLGAVPQLIPPTTGVRLITQAFDAVVQNITDNSELLNTTTWVRYWDTVQRHTAYNSATVSANGAVPTRFVADWFAAIARDLADAFGGEAEPRAVPQRQPTGFFGDGSGASPTPSSSGTGQFPFGTGADGASSSGVTSIPPTDRTGTPSTYPFSTN
ncbi:MULTISPECIES: cutinase family protein [Nocardia]|uniref:Cutinase family protein n=1 Tax=Nocardia implantans TaxID=3108168 RepID=A0ABU6B047_9NOCA|nr:MULTISPECIES: cutinase family protein [unclassified Nocardia]MBF6195204.1 cutinase family protein [Nocardia beijingensis]MEA3530750.1 cutinase family protein [Nocardia sp. CDC192]MEB3513120.1 cutinase family protein [Nocardia sp. CDC186]